MYSGRMALSSWPGSCSKSMSDSNFIAAPRSTFSRSTPNFPSLVVSLKISSPSVSRPCGESGTSVRTEGCAAIIEMNEVYTTSTRSTSPERK